MPVKKAPVVAPERRILKGRETRFSLTRGDNASGTGEPSGLFLFEGFSIEIDLCIFLVLSRATVKIPKTYLTLRKPVCACERTIDSDR